MSGDNGNAPDLDLLADFTAGVLDGTPEGAAVAERIAADPEWAELHAALVRADEAVRADLTALPTEPMPADVFARLDAALAAERAGTTTETPTPTADVVPLRRRSGWRMTAGAVAAGLVVLTAGTIGAELFQDRSSQSDDRESSTAASAPERTNGMKGTDSAVPPKSAPGATNPNAAPDTAAGLLASGTEYRKETLPAQVRVLLTKPSAFADKDTAQAPAEVQKLAGPADLETCLAAIGANGRPLAMDFATYAGSPAVVIVLQGLATGTVDVAIVGPACGQPGPDLKLRTVVKR